MILMVGSSYSCDLLEAFHSDPDSFDSPTLFHTEIPLVMPAWALIALNLYNTVARVNLATCLHTVLTCTSRVTTLAHFPGHTSTLLVKVGPAYLTKSIRML